MSTESQQAQTAQIREEVRKTIQSLNEMAQSESSFDQFCETVLSKVVKITGAHGALLWQVNGDNTPKLTHRAGDHPNEFAQNVTSQENSQHSNAVMEVVNRQMSMGLASDSFAESVSIDPNTALDQSFLMLFSPVFNRAKKCCGTLELLQRGDITPAAQEGYLRFLTQIAQLFQRWHEQQDLAKLTQHSDKWHEKLEFITEVHRSIDPTETAFAIANESRRLIKSDRVSVAKWNGRKCKIEAISSQDRFDNRANVVRLLGNVATSSVSSDTPLWVVGNTEGIAPEVATQINEYLDEAHSRTLIVLPIVAQPPKGPDLEMQSRRKAKDRKLGALIIEYFDADVQEEQVTEQVEMIVKQSELAMENSRVHGEIFMLPIWQRLGWLQKLLFRDHLAKTYTGLACLALLTLFMIFFPKELKMKVSGVMHPTVRKTIFSQTGGVIRQVLIDERDPVEKDQVLLVLENPDLEIEILDSKMQLETTRDRIEQLSSARASGNSDREQQAQLSSEISGLQIKEKNFVNRLELLNKKKGFQQITSPIAGTIVTSQPERLLDYPTSANLAVLEVADFNGTWQLELKIPQNKIGYVSQAMQQNKKENNSEELEVEFRIGTNPNLVLKGILRSVDRRATPSQDGATEYQAFVDADSEQFKKLTDELRTGAGVTAKIHCGKESLGFVCFYQVYDWVRTKVLF